MLGQVECLSTLYKFIIHLPIQCIHINYHIHNIYRVSGNLFSLEVATHVSSCSLNQVSITTGYELVAISTPYRYKMVYIYTRKREAPDDIFSLTGTQQQALKKNPHSTPCQEPITHSRNPISSSLGCHWFSCQTARNPRIDTI